MNEDNEIAPQRELDEKVQYYIRYLRYATELKDPTKLRTRLESLGFNPYDKYHDLFSGGIGYNTVVEGVNVAVGLYPELAIVDIPYRNRIVGEDDILNLPETDTLLLDAIDEEYERLPNKEDTRFPILLAMALKENPWQTLVVQELVKIIKHDKYWK
ncbi:MAG: hypothetical protein IH934_03910 [Nanoarchaeota archaeon]|nr:hypothetical protein [Nanoarchaeota archaeon]